jgi:hypothetical protein
MKKYFYLSGAIMCIVLCIVGSWLFVHSFDCSLIHGVMLIFISLLSALASGTLFDEYTKIRDYERRNF